MRRCIVVGCGGRGGYWTNRVLADMTDQVEVVGLVDVQQEPLDQGAETHGLSESALFTDAGEALDAVEADFALISTPPWIHEANVRAACERELDILMEKPVADTLEASVRIKKMVDEAGVACQIVQNYRYSPFMLAFRKAVQDGGIGRLSYVMARFAADYNPPKSWGKRFRHEMDHALLIEGSVHHFDMIRNVSGRDCEEIFGYGWIPAWADFEGNSNGLYVMKLTDDAYANYEGSCTTEGYENKWHQEYYRAECEEGAVVVGSDNIVKILRVDGEEEVVQQPVDVPEQGEAIVLEFLEYLGTGVPSQTALEDNMKSVGMVFAAIKCDETGRPVNVNEMLAEAEERVSI
ncbi:MAG: Gfo/Idh/MocA family protein [Armatimonadota bacterium]